MSRFITYLQICDFKRDKEYVEIKDCQKNGAFPAAYCSFSRESDGIVLPKKYSLRLCNHIQNPYEQDAYEKLFFFPVV